MMIGFQVLLTDPDAAIISLRGKRSKQELSLQTLAAEKERRNKPKDVAS